VISSEYKSMKYLHNAHRQNLKSHITIIKSCDTVLNSQLT